jgi:2'-5' RNA ligase
VVIVVPDPVATEVDGLRRALGDPVLDRIMPHLTLVPPVNVRIDDLGAALAVLRDAGAAGRPFSLVLGPPRTFAPETDTLYLAVDGDADALAALGRLRDATFRPPLHRSVDHAFVPHVTLNPSIEPSRSDAALAALADYRAAFEVSAVHLLEQRSDAGRRWVPIADVPLGPRVVVGRGGVELELTTSTLLDPEVLGLLADDGTVTAIDPNPAGAIVVTARRRGTVVGVAWCARAGTTTQEPSVVVRERGQGVGRQLRMALASALADADERA